jgi:5,10-methylenetetrahydromethanopterin reductase
MLQADLGMQLPLHVLNRYSLTELLKLVEQAWVSLRDFNFIRIWVNDNLEYRNIFVCASAIVTRVPVTLGTAVTLPYARNPIDMAGAFAALSDLTGGKEISLGLGTGTRSILGEQVEMVKPVTMVAESLICFRKLFAGEEVRRDEFPTLAAFFHLKAASYRLRFPTVAPIYLYYGGFGTPGPRLTRVVGELADGALRGSRLSRTIDESMAIFDGFERARAQSGRKHPLRKAMIINASLSEDGQAARAHAKRFASHVLCDEPDAILEKRGIDLARLKPLRQAYENNQGVDVGATLVPDDLIDKVVIAGTPKDCLEKITELFDLAKRRGFNQLLIGVPLGPNLKEVIEIWAKKILPALRQL